jgi:hypothetical protein
MDVRKRFLEILGNVDFRYNAPVDTPEQLIRCGEYVTARYEALGEERQQRLYDLLCVVLSDVFQPRALARYHDAGFDSIRRALAEEIQHKVAINKLRYVELLKGVIADSGLNDIQEERIGSLLDLIIDFLVRFIARMASRFVLLPRKNAATLALVLNDMFSGGGRSC